MKLRLLAVIFVFALATLSAHAQQIGLYFNPIGMNISNSVADHGPLAFLGDNSKSQNFYGISFGGYYDFFHQGKLTVGLDLRDEYVSGNNARLNSFMVGPRFAISPFRRPIKPYLQAAIGVGTTRPPTNPTPISRAQFTLLGGVDYALGRHIDFRVIEAGYSSLTTVSNATIGGTANIPAARLISVSTGLVFRFR